MYLNTQKINFASPKLYIDSTSSKSLFETCFTQEMSDNIFQRRFLREMLKCLEQSYATSCYDLFFSFLFSPFLPVRLIDTLLLRRRKGTISTYRTWPCTKTGSDNFNDQLVFFFSRSCQGNFILTHCHGTKWPCTPSFSSSNSTQLKAKDFQTNSKEAKYKMEPYCHQCAGKRIS